MDRNFFETKSRGSYPKILNDEIKLLSFNPDDSVLIGSASYKIQKYPADIDLYEQVRTCCSKEDAIEYFTAGIKNIVHNIKSKMYHWVIEVKCGIDSRYDVNVNNKNDIFEFLERNKKENLMSPDDIDTIEILLRDYDSRAIEELEDIFRQYKILRWTALEVEAGEMVRNRKKFYFEECVDTISPINIEVIAIVDGKFTDLSNFYVVMFYDKLSGKDYVVNFSDKYLDEGINFVINGLKAGINKVLFSYYNRDVFKGVKRMYSLARLTNNEALFYKIKPILSSDLAQLSQIKSEISTMYEILEFTDSIPWNVFYKQLDELKWKLGGNTYLSNDQVDYFNYEIDEIIKNTRDVNYIIEQLKELKRVLLDIVNRNTTTYLIKRGIYKYF